MKTNKFMYLYSFDENHELIDVKFLMNEAISVDRILGTVNIIRIRNPNVVEIVAMDQSAELREAFRELLRANDFTMKFEFWDYIVRSGLTVFKK